MSKIHEKIFSINEQNIIQDYVIKKLEVKDLFKLRDRFEGQQFLNNTLKKVYTTMCLMEYLDIPNYQNIKPGFLNTIDFKEFTSLNYSYVDNIEDAENMIIFKQDEVYSYINFFYRKCSLFGDVLNKDKIITHINSEINKVKVNIYT